MDTSHVEERPWTEFVSGVDQLFSELMQDVGVDTQSDVEQYTESEEAVTQSNRTPGVHTRASVQERHKANESPMVTMTRAHGYEVE